MRIERHIARATLATILFASPLFTQQTQTGRVLGVFDDASGQPVVGAEVVDLATKSKTMTSESGVATLAFLSSGTTVLQVRKVGYKDKMLTVVVSPNDTASLTVLLKPVAQALPTVVTKGTAAGVGKLAEFDRRRAMGFGHFLGSAELDKQADRRMSEVLRLFPGLEIVRPRQDGTSRPEWYVTSGRSSQGVGGLKSSTRPQPCPAAVMLDGAFVYQGSGPMFNINSVDTSQLAGIEFYASTAEIPVEYNATRQTCGLLVLWSK
jgi:hypothetical protein